MPLERRHRATLVLFSTCLHLIVLRKTGFHLICASFTEFSDFQGLAILPSLEHLVTLQELDGEVASHSQREERDHNVQLGGDADGRVGDEGYDEAHGLPHAVVAERCLSLTGEDDPVKGCRRKT